MSRLPQRADRRAARMGGRRPRRLHIHSWRCHGPRGVAGAQDAGHWPRALLGASSKIIIAHDAARDTHQHRYHDQDQQPSGLLYAASNL